MDDNKRECNRCKKPSGVLYDGNCPNCDAELRIDRVLAADDNAAIIARAVEFCNKAINEAVPESAWHRGRATVAERVIDILKGGE